MIELCKDVENNWTDIDSCFEQKLKPIILRKQNVTRVVTQRMKRKRRELSSSSEDEKKKHRKKNKGRQEEKAQDFTGKKAASRLKEKK